MTNDLNTLSSLYEAVISNEERFQKINPALIPIIKKAEEKVDWAIRNVQNNDVFFAGILNRMIPDESIRMVDFKEPTMYTDGKSLFYNPEFVNKIPPDAVETVIVHEILHVALGHHLAFADIAKNHQNLWKLVNIACDLAINHLIKDRSGFYKKMLLAGKGEFKDFPKGLDAREYYQLLLKKYQKQPQQQQPQQQGQQSQQGQGQGESEQEEGEGEGSGTGQEQDTPDTGEDTTGSGQEQQDQEGEEQDTGTGEGEGQGEGEEGEGSGSATGSASKEQGDKPSAGQPTGSGVGQGAGAGTAESQAQQDQNIQIPSDVVESSEQLGRISTPEGVTPKNQGQEQIKHEHEMEKEVAQADKIDEEREKAGIKSAGYGKGSTAFTNQNYRDLFKQKSNLPWNTILQEFLTSTEKTDRSYSVMNQRFSEFTRKTGILMPGMKEAKLKDLVFLVDVSGSMPRKACNKIFGEITTVSKLPTFGNNSSIRLISFDAGPLSEAIFTADTKQIYRSVINPNAKVPSVHIYKLPLSETAFSNFKWSIGQGGTHIKPALENIEKYIKPLPDLVVILTDGGFLDDDINYINSVKLPYKIIWLMTTDIEFPNGKTYHLEDYNYDLTSR